MANLGKASVREEVSRLKADFEALRACEFFTNSAYSDKIYPCNREELIQPTVQF